MALKDYYSILASRAPKRRVVSRAPFMNSSSDCIAIG